MAVIALVARLVLSAVFAVAGAAKLADRGGTRSALGEFGLPHRAASAAALTLPAIELGVAVGLLVLCTAQAAGLVALGLLMVFTASISVSLVQGRAPDCHCFGQLHSSPVGWMTLLRNACLAGLAGVVVFAGSSELSPFGWVSELGAAELALTATAVCLAAVLVAQGWFLLELLRQQGRLLTRLDALEGGSPPNFLLGDGLEVQTGAGHGNGNGNHRAGLPAGVPAPEFELPELFGERISLSGLRARGAPVLLVFVDPACGPCSALLPDIAAWQRRHAERLTIAVITRDGERENAEKTASHGLRDVLLQEDREVALAYEAQGTPTAVLISPDGNIGSSLAPGAAAISELVEMAVAPGEDETMLPRLSPSVALGDEVPHLEWDDLDGERVSLRDLLGRPVLVALWNPRCGFCQRLLPALKDWERARTPDKTQLLVVSSGDSAANRAMGLRSRVVIDDAFEAGHAFGASGTPSAIRIDSEGRVASALAVGEPAVNELLAAAPAETAA